MLQYLQSDTCLLCAIKTNKIIDFGRTPIANELLETKKEPETFPLSLMQCRGCRHLQIDCIIPKERLYEHYLYVSDTNQYNRNHFQNYARTMINNFDLDRNSFVLDIGSNDGLFLSYFKDAKCIIRGVDPAKNIAIEANKKGIPTDAEFFSEEYAVNHKKMKADLITCNNAFAHNADLHTIVKGIKLLLKPEGVFVFEVSYAMNLLKDNLFDLIYHEHVHHWHLRAAKEFFRKYELEVFDAEKVPTHGGSIRIYVKRALSKRPSTIRFAKLLKEEELQFEQLVKEFPKKVAAVKKDLTIGLNILKDKNKKISILGYPAKAATLGAYFDLDSNIITNVYDDNALKIGRYSHLGIKIKPSIDMYKDNPDYLLVLSWNYANELMKTHVAFKGKFIIPLPEVRIK